MLKYNLQRKLFNLKNMFSMSGDSRINDEYLKTQAENEESGKNGKNHLLKAEGVDQAEKSEV